MSASETSVNESFTHLIHRIQRERGVTCGWVGGGCVSQFSGLLGEARELSEAAVDANCPQWVLPELQGVRKAADEAVSSSPELRGLQFYAILKRFSALCTRLINESPFAHDESLGAEAFVAFSRLKEATGVERAFLCGALALPEEALAGLPSRAFADLVGQLEEQRRLEIVLRETAPPKLLELVRVGFEHSPELNEVQELLRRDFNIRGLKKLVDAPRCWHLMTEHIDKLEKLQRLVTEHLGSAEGGEEALAAAVLQALDSVVATYGKEEPTLQGASVVARVASAVQAAPADELKAAMLRALNLSGMKPQLNGDAQHLLQVTLSRVRRSRSHLSLTKPSVEGVPADLRVPLPSLVFIRRIGAGTGGTTYLATKDDEAVTVKVAGAGGVEAWRTEVRALAGLNHPNIVRYLGAVIEPPTYGLVVQYFDGKDLDAFVKGETPKGFFFNVAEAVGQAMAYLHQEGILHRDLKGSNVLVSQGGEVKVADFGLHPGAPEDITEGMTSATTSEPASYRWMAPEAVRQEPYGKPGDVYSYAMVLLEVLTHQLPWSDRTPLQAAIASSFSIARPRFPPGVPQHVNDLICACWRVEAAERPTFDELLGELREMKGQLSSIEVDWLDAPHGHQV